MLVIKDLAKTYSSGVQALKESASIYNPVSSAYLDQTAPVRRL